MGLVQFQIAPRSSLHVSISIGPFRCGRSYLQGFYSVAPVPSEAVPFVYLACLPVSSVSNFRPDTGGRRWSLAQVRVFSRAAGREGSADKSHWPVWGALMVFWPHWVCPRSWVCVLSPSTLLRLPAAVYGAGPALRALPVFGSSTKAWTRLGLRFVPSLAEQLRPPGA